MRILVVRLSALGDLVHTLPAVAALRRAFPDAEIDWFVDERFREVFDVVSGVDRVVTLPRSGLQAWRGVWRVTRELRRRRYDIAIDAQGLLKSALAARLSGARRVIGFDASHLREPVARFLYTESASVPAVAHVVEKNLALVAHLGVTPGTWEFPIEVRESPSLARTRSDLALHDGDHFVLLNPGTSWPSKCWAPEWFGLLAKRLREDLGVRSAVSWGPGEEALGHTVAGASDGAAQLTPPTGIVDLVAHVRAAAVVVAGDTGPLHLAAAVGTPVVGIYGPSDPRRNGPWSADDHVVSQFTSCRCQLARAQAGLQGVVVRRCVQTRRCLDEISVDDVLAAVKQRLGRRDSHV